jgi:hypothetical protein
MSVGINVWVPLKIMKQPEKGAMDWHVNSMFGTWLTIEKQFYI